MDRKKTHIFFYVVNRSDDPFSGIKSCLQNVPGHSIIDLRFSEDEYRVVQEVEYSIKKYFRFIFYQNVYRRFKCILNSELEVQDREAELIIYLADEGVWAEYLHTVLQPWIGKFDIQLINIQHGFFELGRWASERGVAIIIRKLLNRISCMLFGFSNFGLAFGRGNLDTYLVYGANEKKFLQNCGVNSVFVGPGLIKYEFIQRFLAKKQEMSCVEDTVLFVMPHFVPGTGISCTLQEFLIYLEPIFRTILDGFSQRILLRFHPGMKEDAWRSALSVSGLVDIVEVDLSPDISSSMAVSSYVMSLHSTALFEALVVGLVPVRLITPYVSAELSFEHEVVDSGLRLEPELERVFSTKTIDAYQDKKVINTEESLFLASLGLNGLTSNIQQS